MKRTKIVYSFSIVTFILVLFFTPFFQVLSLTNKKNTSEKIYFLNASNGFCVSYTHSVNKGRVHDFYNSDSARNLILYKTEFKSYGAGMPEIEETPGAVFYQTDDSYVMEYKRNLGKSFLLFVGVIANHSITLKKEFFLKDFFEPKTSLIVELKKISLFDFFYKRKNIFH